MKYPIFTLNDEFNNTFLYAEYPHSIETGSFLKVSECLDFITVKVDRFSTIPFYYIVLNKRLYGSTKLSLLLESLPGSFDRRMDIEAAIDFLRTNTLMSGKTLIAGIKRISFGHALSFNKTTGSVEENKYWELPGDISSKSRTDILNDLEDEFLNTIKMEIDGSKKIGMHLSGGMDSRNIMGALLRLKVPFTTYTYGVNENLDVSIAKLVSKKLSLDSNFIEWDGLNSLKDNSDLHFNLTDGMQSLIHGHGIETNDKESREVDTILYGHFLDFFIQGHKYDYRFEGKESGETTEFLYQLFNGGPCSIINGDKIEGELFTNDYIGMFRSSIEREINKLDYMIPEKRYDALYFIHHGLRRLMPQVQSGAQFLDFRTPGLKEDYFKIAWSVPGRFKQGRSLQEELLRRLHSGMMDFPVVKDNKHLCYMGKSKTKRLLSSAQLRIKNSRFRFLFNEYDYYGQGHQRLANTQLYGFMKAEILSAELENFGFLRREFIESLFETGEFRFNVSLYSTFYTLSKFVNKYGLIA